MAFFDLGLTGAKSFSRNVQLVECPRDAMQGWKNHISTEKKIRYLNNLLKVGFDTIDCGSFVSSKAIPQMADTNEVISNLSLENSKTRLLVIVANKRGAEEAVRFDQITYLGFPFSISPTFQFRNTNSSIDNSVQRVEEIQNLCLKSNKEMVIYLSMAFGNPYGDEYDDETLLYWADEMVKRNIKVISLADTVGVATPDQIKFALSTLIPTYPQATFGVHLHSTQTTMGEKLEAAITAGCKRFDGTLKGIGGCPLAGNELVGNMNTELMMEYFKEYKILPPVDATELQNALALTDEVFQK